MVRFMEDPKDFDEMVVEKKKLPLWLKIAGGILIGLIVFLITYVVMYLLL
jgi:hypothetical protein